jgi:hypothetical protein
MKTKLDHTIGRLEEWFEKYSNPVVMSSFGKDSMVMLYIIRTLMERRMPVIYHANPWKPWKNDWAWEIIKRWKLEVYDFPPLQSGIKVKPERLEIVNRYVIGKDLPIDNPINILPPEDDFMCGLAMLARPKGAIVYPWNLTLIGHKSSDIDEFEGHMPLKSDLVEGPLAVGYPLKEWSDEDLWHFIETRSVPVQYKTRYHEAERREIRVKVFNNDWIEACTRCIDPREPEKVFCPLLEKEIPNVSETVTKFTAKPINVGGEE